MQLCKNKKKKFSFFCCISEDLTLDLTLLLILANYGMPQFFREPNLVFNIFRKFQVNSIPISILMTIL